MDLNDKYIIAYWSPHTNKVTTSVFDFRGLKPGSPARAARCAEFDRFIEALEGQGCKVGFWHIESWGLVQNKVFFTDYLKNKSQDS